MDLFASQDQQMSPLLLSDFQPLRLDALAVPEQDQLSQAGLPPQIECIRKLVHDEAGRPSPLPNCFSAGVSAGKFVLGLVPPLLNH